MNRDGSDSHEFYSSPNQEANNPTWSPDGTQILFARGKGENNKLYKKFSDRNNSQGASFRQMPN